MTADCCELKQKVRAESEFAVQGVWGVRIEDGGSHLARDVSAQWGGIGRRGADRVPPRDLPCSRLTSGLLGRSRTSPILTRRRAAAMPYLPAGSRRQLPVDHGIPNVLRQGDILGFKPVNPRGVDFVPKKPVDPQKVAGRPPPVPRNAGRVPQPSAYGLPATNVDDLSVKSVALR